MKAQKSCPCHEEITTCGECGRDYRMVPIGFSQLERRHILDLFRSHRAVLGVALMDVDRSIVLEVSPKTNAPYRDQLARMVAPYARVLRFCQRNDKDMLDVRILEEVDLGTVG